MLISNAYAQTAGAAAGPDMITQIVLFGGMFAVMWFLMIRPQMKKAKEHKAILESLQKGDEVMTQGGVAGKVASVGESYVRVEIADGVEVLVQKAAVATVLPKGTLKSA